MDQTPPPKFRFLQDFAFQIIILGGSDTAIPWIHFEIHGYKRMMLEFEGNHIEMHMYIILFFQLIIIIELLNIFHK